MAKIITYKFQSGEEQLPASIKCKSKADFDVNYHIAEMEAVPGTISVNGEFETEQPTQLDRIEAQTTYTAMMTDTLLGV